MKSMRYVQLSWKDCCFQLILYHYNLEHSIVSFLLLDVHVDFSKYFRHSTQSYHGVTHYSYKSCFGPIPIFKQLISHNIRLFSLIDM